MTVASLLQEGFWGDYTPLPERFGRGWLRLKRKATATCRDIAYVSAAGQAFLDVRDATFYATKRKDDAVSRLRCLSCELPAGGPLATLPDGGCCARDSPHVLCAECKATVELQARPLPHAAAFSATLTYRDRP